MSDKLLLEKFDKIPNLLILSQNSGKEDVYGWMETLKVQHEKKRSPYLTAMPYRHRVTCSTQEHDFGEKKYTLVNPKKKTGKVSASVVIWELQLHESKVHGAALPEDVAAFLGELVI